MTYFVQRISFKAGKLYFFIAFQIFQAYTFYLANMGAFMNKIVKRNTLKLILITGLLTMSFQANAQSRADKAAKIREQLEQLDDPDPLYRMLALEEIMESNNRILKKMALDKSLNSGDKDLEEIALPLILANYKAFTVEVIKGRRRSNDTPTSLMAKLPKTGLMPANMNPIIEAMVITNMDTSSGIGYAKNEKYMRGTDQHATLRLQGNTLRVTYTNFSSLNNCQVSYNHVGDMMFIGQGNCNGNSPAASRIQFK